jgi:magnesium transporter
MLGELLNTPDLSALSQWLADTPVHEVAGELTRLDGAEQATVFRLLSREQALAVFEMLDPPVQQAVLDGLRDDRHRELIEDMEPDDRARLLSELPATVATRALAGLSEAERLKTAALLGYPEQSAGRLMSPEFVSLRSSITVAAALAKVRAEGADAETVYLLPVTDEQRRLIGVVSLRQLVLADPTASIGSLMSTTVLSVSAYDDQEDAARLLAASEVLAVPVLDREERIVGIITVDDAMTVLEEEETEDQALHGATQPLGRPYLTASVLAVARSRALWLLVLIAAAALTVNVLQAFESTLEAVVTLALFIPLLIDTGGNAGSQAATVVIRAMAVGDVRFGDLPRVVWREARVGVLLGAMLAAIGFIPIALLFEPRMGVVVSVSILAICSVATVAGSTLPMLARRLGIDPAVMSAPLITTLVDASGLVVYFLVARAVLGL